MGVYDPLLKEDEVFIQISNPNKNAESEIINNSEVVIFKKFQLYYDGVQKFKTVTDPDLQKHLAKKYL